MSDLQNLDFSFNWNGKLNCQYFTTLRLSGKWQVGQRANAMLKTRKMGVVECVEKHVLKNRGQISELIAALDTGYSAAETRDILTKMYPTKSVAEWATTPIFYYLFRFVERQSAQKSLFE